ncbi:MAG TPA: ABC transporter substrate-binding protein [Caldimonas sp.]|jgi:putative ABC transport system substrate-binding protein|nr:ABC transporter substrate-binding protein [Caldimonas sp.]
MKRRRLLFAAAAVAALPGLCVAQARTARIGWLTAQRPPSLEPFVKAFRDALAALGFVEGKNLTIVFRYGDDDLGKVRGLADELARAPVDLIVVQGEAALEIKSMNLPTPVVYAYSADPVIAGLAQSLARPNANMTGLTYMAVELNGKRLELLREMTPGVRRVALLANPAYPGQDNERSSSESTGGRIGLDVRYTPARTSDELAAAFAKMAADKVQAISVLADSFTVQNRDSIIAFGMQQRIPVVASWPVFARSGALCSYGPRLSDSYQRLAYYVDRVLRGTKPAELPIEQPTTIETTVNLKTADALGLQVPQAVLVRADQVLR